MKKLSRYDEYTNARFQIKWKNRYLTESAHVSYHNELPLWRSLNRGSSTTHPNIILCTYIMLVDLCMLHNTAQLLVSIAGAFFYQIFAR